MTDLTAPASAKDFASKLSKLSKFMKENGLELAHLAQVIAHRLPENSELFYRREDGVILIRHITCFHYQRDHPG